MIEDPYKVLGLGPDASDEDVKKAYRRLVSIPPARTRMR